MKLNTILIIKDMYKILRKLQKFINVFYTNKIDSIFQNKNKSKQEIRNYDFAPLR